jgi:hypothetical protein
MKDDEVKAIVSTAYQRFERTMLSTAGMAALSPQVESVIRKTLRQLETELKTNPEYLAEIVQETRKLSYPPES